MRIDVGKEDLVTELDRIPRELYASLEEKGIAFDEVLLALYCDRDAQMQPRDTYLFATKDRLILLGGIMTLEKDGDTPKKKKGLKRIWSESEYITYPITELCGFRVEELLSAGRLIVSRKPSSEEENASPENPTAPSLILLTYFTNFCKESVLIFAKYAEQLTLGKELNVDPQDERDARYCPKCGMRYPDSNRPICPRCMEKGRLFLRFSKFLMRYKGYLILLVLSLLLMTGAGILVPYLSSGFFYDEVIYGTGAFAGELILALVMIISVRLLRVLATVVNSYASAIIAPKVIYDLKKTIFSSIKNLSLRFFTSRQTGGLMTQINEDSNTIYTFFCDGLPYMLVNVMQIVVVTVLMFWISPLLAVLTLLIVPAFFLATRWIFRRQRHLHAKRYVSSSQMNGLLADVFSGIRVVKAFSKEEAEIERFSVSSERLAKNDKKMGLFSNYAWPAAGMLLALGNVVAWGIGGWMVIQGELGLTYGLLLTFIAYMNMVFEPMNFFVDFISRSADCSNSIQRLFEIMDAHSDVSEREDAKSPEQLNGRVEFRDVSFSYQAGRKVIDRVSFSVDDGKILGIVGHTGAGKSTLANLLMRLYDTDEGEILVGGYPIKELSFDVLHRNIAIVSQETYLFVGTILDNIRYARPDATLEEVIRAAKYAGAHDFIMKMPDAYHTRVGFGYQDLSGGERQRISIARAVLKDPKILILDEATASMDTQTERRIQEALAELVRGKTTIMIAHRLSTLRDADELIVIEHGKVAESGTHRTLLEKEDGIYKKLYTLQEEALKSAGIRE